MGAIRLHQGLKLGLCAGTYGVLPSCIEDLAGPPEPPPPAQQAATLRLMDHILRVTLLQVILPYCWTASWMMGRVWRADFGT